tara:strand:- start:130 stop:333 length:204 start_codon:yes stop_codon:yes gene_type:complete
MILKSIILAVLLNFTFTINANAYIDPGIISVIFQAIVGTIVAGGIAIKIYWHKFKNIFKRKKRNKSD